MAKSPRQNSALQVGTKVKLNFGGREVLATIIEDRGPLGVGRRQLLRVRLDIEDIGEPIEFELPAADVHVAA